MRDWLVFRLYGPFAAWGEAAVGEFRPTADHPTRTAVLGLVAAALGIDRDDEPRLLRLDQSFGMTVLLEAEGAAFRDFHTAQVPSARRGPRPPSRRLELLADDLNTILSNRDYRVDALYRVGLWTKASCEWSLAQVSDALEQPVFAPYLGRRACALALPMTPRTMRTETLAEALTHASLPELPTELSNLLLRRARQLSRRVNGDEQSSLFLRVYWEGGVNGLTPEESGLEVRQTTPRSQVLVSRRRYQFASCPEHQGVLSLTLKTLPDKEGSGHLEAGQ